MGILNLVYCYLFLFVSLAVIQAIYIDMVFMSLDESIGKIEVDPKEEASVGEVFQDVDKLSDVGEKEQAIEIL
jgi:hypothetical protein